MNLAQELREAANEFVLEEKIHITEYEETIEAENIVEIADTKQNLRMNDGKAEIFIIFSSFFIAY